MLFSCMADMGSVKIVSSGMNICFSNGFGDGLFGVYINKKPRIKRFYPDGAKGGWKYVKGHEVNFVGHFTVKKENTVKIAEYDCGKKTFDFTFPTGRWFVENYRGDIYINKVDDMLHA